MRVSNFVNFVSVSAWAVGSVFALSFSSTISFSEESKDPSCVAALDSVEATLRAKAQKYVESPWLAPQVFEAKLNTNETIWVENTKEGLFFYRNGEINVVAKGQFFTPQVIRVRERDYLIAGGRGEILVMALVRGALSHRWSFDDFKTRFSDFPLLTVENPFNGNVFTEGFSSDRTYLFQEIRKNIKSGRGTLFVDKDRIGYAFSYRNNDGNTVLAKISNISSPMRSIEQVELPYATGTASFHHLDLSQQHERKERMQPLALVKVISPILGPKIIAIDLTTLRLVYRFVCSKDAPDVPNAKGRMIQTAPLRWRYFTPHAAYSDKPEYRIIPIP